MTMHFLSPRLSLQMTTMIFVTALWQHVMAVTCAEGGCDSQYQCRYATPANVYIQKEQFETVVLRGLKKALPIIEKAIEAKTLHIESGADTKICTLEYIKKIKAENEKAKQKLRSYIRKKVEKNNQPLYVKRDADRAPYAFITNQKYDQLTAALFADDSNTEFYNQKLEAARAEYKKAFDEETKVIGKWADAIRKNEIKYEDQLRKTDATAIALNEAYQNIPSLWQSCSGLPKMITSSNIGFSEMADPLPGRSVFTIHNRVQFDHESARVSCQEPQGLCEIQLDILAARISGAYQFKSLSFATPTELGFDFSAEADERTTYSFTVNVASNFQIMPGSLRILSNEEDYNFNLPKRENVRHKNISGEFLRQIDSIASLSQLELAGLFQLILEDTLIITSKFESHLNRVVPNFVNKITSGVFHLPDLQKVLIRNSERNSFELQNEIEKALEISYRRTQTSYADQFYHFQFALCSQQPSVDFFTNEAVVSAPLVAPCSLDYDFAAQIHLQDVNTYLTQLFHIGAFRDLCAKSHSDQSGRCQITVSINSAPQFEIKNGRLYLKVKDFELRGDVIEFPILAQLARLDSVRDIEIRIPELRGDLNSWSQNDYIKIKRTNTGPNPHLVREILHGIFGDLFSNSVFDFIIDTLDGSFGFFVGRVTKRFANIFTTNQLEAGLEKGVDIASNNKVAFAKEIRATNDGTIHVFADFARNETRSLRRQPHCESADANLKK